MSDIYTLIKEHLEKQPWIAECADCGETLTVDTEVDTDGDLKISVVPCKKCKENE